MLLYESNTIIHSNSQIYQLTNITIDEEYFTKEYFEFTRNGIIFNPKLASYGFITKIFEMTPEENQLVDGDQIIMKILSK